MSDEAKDIIEDEADKPIDADELNRMAAEIDSENRKFYNKANSFLKRHKKGEKIPMAEQMDHVEWRKLINSMEKSYKAMVAMAKLRGITSQHSGGKMVDMAAVRDQPDTMKEIVQKTN